MSTVGPSTSGSQERCWETSAWPERARGGWGYDILKDQMLMERLGPGCPDPPPPGVLHQVGSHQAKRPRGGALAPGLWAF